MADKDGGAGVSMDLFWAFIVVVTLLTLWVQNGGPTRARNEGLLRSPTTISNQTLRTNPKTSDQDDNGEGIVYSPYRGKIRIGRGTAASTYQPGQEYIILSASGNERPINIGGWTLKNGTDRHLNVISGDVVRVPATTVKIPNQGVTLYDPYHPLNNKRGPITLKSGEQAIIITGNPPVLSGVKITDNFKLNRCLGYLEDAENYRANPSMRYHCPSNDDVPGINELDNTCYDFVRSISPCHQPKDVYVKDEGYCLDGNCKLKSYCRQFVETNYNFGACFTRYASDEDFVAPEWWIFLKQEWEIWANRREVISLYDRSGLLVDEVSY